IIGASQSPPDAQQLKLWLTISARKRLLEVSWKNAPLREGDIILLTAEDPLSFEQRANHSSSDDGYTTSPSTVSSSESTLLWVANGGATGIKGHIKPRKKAQWFTTGVTFNYTLSRNATTQSSCYGYWASYIDATGRILAKTCVRAYPRWMTEMRDKLGELRLRDLFIPGTHDSGSYRPNFDPLKNESIVTKYTLTQDDDIHGQLVHGARYLDIRVGYFRSLEKKFFIYHGTKGQPLQEVIQMVKEFVKKTNEIVIFGLKEFPVGFGENLDDHKLLVEYLKEHFGDVIVKHPLTWNSTLNDIWKQHQNVILAYDKDEIVKNYTQFVFQAVEQNWGNAQTWEKLEDYLNSTYRILEVPVADMAELTPRDRSTMFFDTLGGLRQMADNVNCRISQLYRGELGEIANIVAADYIRGTTLMDTAIDINLRKWNFLRENPGLKYEPTSLSLKDILLAKKLEEIEKRVKEIQMEVKNINITSLLYPLLFK
ncbi:PI-PLC X domain-containing protein 3-like, partial [Drosophila albomicans]|uniref:PI-PLC X domain-containing protein 3-like n=1 Tax=Drosophila albomicans TaxID=7291 RepID=A0A6P8W808_DROAB